MSPVKKIQCTGCGATSVFKTNDGAYKCNYCQTNFVLQNKDEYSNVEPAYTFDTETIIKKNKTLKKVIISIIFTFAIITTSTTFLLSFFENTSKTIVKSLKNYTSNWQEPYIEKTFFYDDKHIGIIGKSQTGSLDSAVYFISTFDLSSKKNVNKKVIYIGSWHYLTFKNIPEFYYLNNLIYCFDKDSGLIAFNPKTFKQTLYSTNFKNNFEVLKNGISKIYKANEEDYFVIENINNDSYYYNVSTNELMSSEDFRKNKKSEQTEISTVFFTQNEHPMLVYATIKSNLSDIKYKIPLSDTNSINKIEKMRSKPHGIKSIKLVDRKNYCNPTFLCRYNEGIILKYSKNISPSSEIIISYINKQGVTEWEKSDKDLQSIFKSEERVYSSSCYILNDKLFVTIQSSPRKFVCIDTKTGEIIWQYSSEDLKIEL